MRMTILIGEDTVKCAGKRKTISMGLSSFVRRGQSWGARATSAQHTVDVKQRETTYRCSGFWRAEKDDFN